ncbi:MULTISPECIES: hypothetical protein [unclassified Cyanobium]|uniref:hypothetical protein n=1 Tax=unclassified Cyanobium TaxID=2627006 RepID=UPI0021032CD1|nr:MULTISPECIES: hypothetical protein [unclassified Cyanobium]
MILDRFPDSSHVRLLGLGGADDLVIWEKARPQGDLPGYRQRRQCCNSGPVACSRRGHRGILHPS